MQALKFSVAKDDRIYVSGQWIVNGHWLLTKQAALKIRPLKKFITLPDGTYTDEGYESPEMRKMPDVQQVIPRTTDNYVSLDLEFGGKAFVDESFNIRAVAYTTKTGMLGEDFKIGIAPEYCRLLMVADEVLVKSPNEAIVLKSHGNLIGLIMPVRL